MTPLGPVLLCVSLAISGTISAADKNGLLIATGLEYLLIREVQLEGSKRMEVGPFLQGHQLEPGTRLG